MDETETDDLILDLRKPFVLLEESIDLREEDFAKVNYEGERFWVEVLGRAEDGSYRGRVDNKLVMAYPGYPKYNDVIRFLPAHVYDVSLKIRELA